MHNCTINKQLPRRTATTLNGKFVSLHLLCSLSITAPPRTARQTQSPPSVLSTHPSDWKICAEPEDLLRDRLWAPVCSQVINTVPLIQIDDLRHSRHFCVRWTAQLLWKCGKTRTTINLFATTRGTRDQRGYSDLHGHRDEETLSISFLLTLTRYCNSHNNNKDSREQLGCSKGVVSGEQGSWEIQRLIGQAE